MSDDQEPPPEPDMPVEAPAAETPPPPEARRMSLFQPAVKEKLKGRVAIDGPTGSGKTWTGLQAARILAGPNGLIGAFDTENRSAAYYAPTPRQLAGLDPMDRLNYWDPPYIFGHAPISPPYDPRLLTKWLIVAADEVGEDGCLLVDSLTHFWTGEGGTLDLVDDAAARSGNSFAGWKEGTPAQRYLLDTIIHLPCHIVVTMRSKMEYIVETQTRGGKTTQVPRKVGMAPEQRAGIEYEFTVVADMDLEHRLIVSKSRCSLIADEVVQSGRSSEVWERFATWLDSGVERITFDQASALVAAMNSVMDPDDRTVLKKAFIDVFGKPTELTTDRSMEAVEWVRSRVARLNGLQPVDTGGGSPADGPSPSLDAGPEPEPEPEPEPGPEPDPDRFAEFDPALATEPDEEPAVASDSPEPVAEAPASPDADSGPQQGALMGDDQDVPGIEARIAEQAAKAKKARSKAPA